MRLIRLAIVFLLLVVCLLTASSSPAADSDKPPARDVAFFEKKVRPLLAQHCYECHGPDEQESSLRLDSLAGMLRGGDAGPAIIAGKPEQSLLVTAIGYGDSDLRMPPDGKLSAAEIADLTRWIRLGAPHPEAGSVTVAPRHEIDIEEGRLFWSFQPLQDAAPPAAGDSDWAQSPIDQFILAKLAEHGLRPAPRADQRTLIRRATFDLIGLPPAPEHVEQFLSDGEPGAFARVVDRLLASPQYGERWGRHWLDVARYADSNGLDENIAHGNAWRYRDYVVTAMNDDKPFDEFVIEQLAGDMLPPTDDVETRHQRLIATGFLSLGPKVLAEVDEKKMEMDIVDEQIDTLGRALLGLTFGCARCHDHKFDPLTQRDYYALAGIFKSTRTMEHFTKIARWWENPLLTPQLESQLAAHESKLTAKKAEIQEVVDDASEESGGAASSGETAPKNAEEKFPAETKARLKQLRDELAKLEKETPQAPTAMGVTDGTIADTQLHVRGSHLTLGDAAPRRVPMVLAGANQPIFGEESSGRLQLAQWLTADEHPLTSRVMVNRIWRWHFGEGLVRSTDNFGQLGERPVNQPLLDWLARRFNDDGRSLKKMHRLIMLSSTYQMSSAFDPEAARIDPENRLQWRFNIRRLEAEALRDSLLAVGGMLDTSMGGSLLHVGNREFIFNHTSEDETKYDSRRRSLYLPVVRNHLYDVFDIFDYADASRLSGDRSETTVAPQALFMMNSDLVWQACDNLAGELLACKTDDSSRVQRLFAVAYARPATAEELKKSIALLGRFQAGIDESPESAEAPRRRAWTMLCQVIAAANEFMYVR